MKCRFSATKTPITVKLPESGGGGQMNLDVIELDSYVTKK